MKPPDPEVEAALQEEREHEGIKHKEVLTDVKLKYEPPKPRTRQVAGRKRFLVSDHAVKHADRSTLRARLRFQLGRLVRTNRRRT